MGISELRQLMLFQYLIMAALVGVFGSVVVVLGILTIIEGICVTTFQTPLCAEIVQTIEREVILARR